MMGSEMEIPDELIDQLLGEYTGPEQLTAPDGLINMLRKRLIERAAGAELERHLGYPQGLEAPDGQPNRRNGVSVKTLPTVDGPVTVELPRDRDASFEPQVVPKHARSFDAFDDQITDIERRVEVLTTSLSAGSLALAGLSAQRD
jgi:putative transposase